MVVLGRFVKVVQRKPDRDGFKFAGGNVNLAEQACEGHKRFHEHWEYARARSRVRNSKGQGRVVLKRAGEYSRGRADLVLAEPLNAWGCRLRYCHFALRIRIPGEILRVLQLCVNGTCGSAIIDWRGEFGEGKQQQLDRRPQANSSKCVVTSSVEPAAASCHCTGHFYSAGPD